MKFIPETRDLDETREALRDTFGLTAGRKRVAVIFRDQDFAADYAKHEGDDIDEQLLDWFCERYGIDDAPDHPSFFTKEQLGLLQNFALKDGFTLAEEQPTTDPEEVQRIEDEKRKRRVKLVEDAAKRFKEREKR